MSHKMLATERLAAISLASVFSLRLFGLFSILPVLSIYLDKFPDANLSLLGLALGIYGLTQAALQIPLGMCSDRFGRKPIIISGLLVFVLGSLLAANAHTLTAVICGRALQGAGAIGSTIMAYVADLTREQVRTRAMALVGSMIGLAFALAMVCGPAIAATHGLAGIFLLTAALGTLAIFIVAALPTKQQQSHELKIAAYLKNVLILMKDKQLLTLNLGIFCLHALLTALFSVVPLLLQQHNILKAQQSFIYLVVLLAALIGFVPLVFWLEKTQKRQAALFSAILGLGVSLLLMNGVYQAFNWFILSLIVFFICFNFLEALLPSWVSKIAPSHSRGAALSIYSSSQYLGIFIGGTLSGILQHWQGIAGVFYFGVLLCAVWLSTSYLVFKLKMVDNSLGREIL